MAGVGNYLMGAIAVVGSVITAAFFGGFLFAIARGASFVDIAVMLVCFIIAGAIVFVFFLRDNPENLDFLLLGIGATAGLILYPLAYLHTEGLSDIGTGELVVSGVLIVLAAVTVVFTYRLYNGKKAF